MINSQIIRIISTNLCREVSPRESTDKSFGIEPLPFNWFILHSPNKIDAVISQKSRYLNFV